MSYHRVVLRICLGFCALLWGAACVQVQGSDPVPTEGAESGILVILNSTDEAGPYLKSFTVSEGIRAPGTISDETQIFELTYSCSLEELGLPEGDLKVAEGANSLPYPNSAFEWLETGEWAARPPAEALATLEDIKVESTFNPCPIWEAGPKMEIEEARSSTTSLQGFLFADGDHAIAGFATDGVFRAGIDGIANITTSVSYLTLAKRANGSIVGIANDASLRSFEDGADLGASLPPLSRFETLIDFVPEAGEDVLYFATNRTIFRRFKSNAWEPEVMPSPVTFAPNLISSVIVLPRGSGEVFATFSPKPGRRMGNGVFFRIVNQEPATAIELPEEEEVSAFAVSSDPDKLFVGTEAETAGRVYAYENRSFTKLVDEDVRVRAVADYDGVPLVAYDSGELKANFGGLECVIAVLQERPRRILLLNNRSMVVLTKNERVEGALAKPSGFITVLRETKPLAPCGLAPPL